MAGLCFVSHSLLLCKHLGNAPASAPWVAESETFACNWDLQLDSRLIVENNFPLKEKKSHYCFLETGSHVSNLLCSQGQALGYCSLSLCADYRCAPLCPIQVVMETTWATYLQSAQCYFIMYMRVGDVGSNPENIRGYYHQLGRKATSLKMMMQRGWRVWRNRREHKIIVSVETRQCSLTVCGLFLAPRISLLWICPLFYNTKFIQDYLRSWSRRMFLGTWAKWNHITEWMLCKCVPNQQYRRKYGLPTKKHSLQFWLCRQKMKCIEIEAINIITKSALGAPIYNSSTQKVEAGWLLWTWTKLGLYTEALS